MTSYATLDQRSLPLPMIRWQVIMLTDWLLLTMLFRIYKQKQAYLVVSLSLARFDKAYAAQRTTLGVADWNNVKPKQVNKLSSYKILNRPVVHWHYWLGERKSIRPAKNCLTIWQHGCLSEWGADDLHMVQLMPVPPHHLSFSKIQNGLSFWYWPTQVVLEKSSAVMITDL